MAEKSNVTRIRQLILEKSESLFKENFSELNRAVAGYESLKEVYSQQNHKLSENRDFQKKFTSFYVMRYVSQTFRTNFFVKMDEIRNSKQTELNAIEIMRNLCNGEKSLQFSFITKMLNLADDTRYPIYDSMVAKVFGFKELSGAREQKLEEYKERYQKILATYSELQKDTLIQKVLTKFRTKFQCPNLSDFRVLDFICWQLGKLKIVYIDMDNVLVDFQSGIDRLDATVLSEYENRLDEVPHIFSYMQPKTDAVESFDRLAEQYDVYILSTAPWNNPSAWSDKLEWVKRYLGDKAYKRLILTHHKNLNKGDYLIDDRTKNGADCFDGKLILFGSDEFPDWTTVVKYLCD